MRVHFHRTAGEPSDRWGLVLELDFGDRGAFQVGHVVSLLNNGFGVRVYGRKHDKRGRHGHVRDEWFWLPVTFRGIDGRWTVRNPFAIEYDPR